MKSIFMELTKIFYFFEKVSKSLVKGSVLVRYWFGDFSHGSGFGSAEPKNPGSVVHYRRTKKKPPKRGKNSVQNERMRLFIW